MATLDLDKMDKDIAALTADEMRDYSLKATQAKRALARTEGDASATWSTWALVPGLAPDWLWTLVRKGIGNGILDNWSVGFVNDSLAIIASDVRVSSTGKPASQLSFFRSSLSSYVDDTKLMKWANSVPYRSQLVSDVMTRGDARNIIEAARNAYTDEKLEMFALVFKFVGKSELDEMSVPTVPQYNPIDTQNDEVGADYGYEDD